MSRRPTLLPDESIAAYLTRLDEWRAQGPWTPANSGTEVPFETRSGHRLLYVWQQRTGRHAYLDLGTDLILSDADAATVLGYS